MRFRRIKRVWRFAVATSAILLVSQLAMAQMVVPNLPVVDFDYYGYAVTNLPMHFQEPVLVDADNTPVDNPITNAGATLGRVLFYDKQMSHDYSVACASCHQQASGFGDPQRFSQGVNGQTGRHSMALSNAKFYESGKAFWDERADSLEDQALMPIQDPVEMNLDLATLTTRLENTPYYAQLFEDAFGTSEVNSDRIAKAIAQFERSMVSYQSAYDQIFDASGVANLELLDTEQRRGFEVFHSSEGLCATCHVSAAQIADQARNIGLDEIDTDPGSGDGKFKSPSLRNVEVRGRYMHDGRFSSLEEVIEFYSTGIHKNNPNLDPTFIGFEGNFPQEDKDALLTFLKMLTDWNFLTDEKFSDPFVFACDFDANGACGLDDLNGLLANGPVGGGIPVDGSNQRYDINSDGVLNNDDVVLWLSEAALVDGLASPYKSGDANLDGFVDGQDFILWNDSRFTASLAWNDGDFNGDGFVDGQDFILWNENKFTSSDVATVPEPTTGLLLLIGLFVMRRRRQRTMADY
jgi:cytochrome c peroxidase